MQVIGIFLLHIQRKLHFVLMIMIRNRNFDSLSKRKMSAENWTGTARVPFWNIWPTRTTFVRSMHYEFQRYLFYKTPSVQSAAEPSTDHHVMNIQPPVTLLFQAYRHFILLRGILPRKRFAEYISALWSMETLP